MLYLEIDENVLSASSCGCCSRDILNPALLLLAGLHGHAMGTTQL